MFEGTRATGVEVRHGGEDDHWCAAARSCVSCGALQSPALLMRSGVGPARELAALGIDVVADRPGVGKHLMEHPGVNFGFYLKPGARLPRRDPAADVRCVCAGRPAMRIARLATCSSSPTTRPNGTLSACGSG